MKTAALLPTPGDPFLLRHWLRNYVQVWHGEVDELHVLVNGQPDPEVRAYIRMLVETHGGRYDERDGGTMNHGHALNVLVHDCDADLLVLMEDDVRVCLPNQFRERFAVIRNGDADVIASPRVSMTPGIATAAREKWGDNLQRDLGSGQGMWPAFVFVRRDALLSTDRNYGEQSWGRGQVVPGLGHRVEVESEVADTFGSVAFQLRDRFKVLDDVQYKGPWGWPQAIQNKHLIPWFHIGSLSSSGDLCGVDPTFADGRTLTDKHEIGEWAHRLSWWQRFLRLAGNDLPEQQARYRHNIERLMQRMGVKQSDIDVWVPIVDELVTWSE